MSDYSKSVIYMIKKKDDDDNENIYIGSTKDFKQRKWDHKKSCNNPNSVGYNMKVYQYIRENGGWDNFVMDVILAYPCNDKYQLKLREDEIICEINSKLNTNRANRGQKQYYQDNLDKIKEKKKKYHQKNKEKIKEQMKEYRELNEEKIKEQSKKYRKLNKEKLAEKTREYQQNNKDKIKEWNRKAYLKRRNNSE